MEIKSYSGNKTLDDKKHPDTSLSPDYPKRKQQHFGYDTIGDIAILKFQDKTSLKEKKKLAEKLLLERTNLKTILEKTEKVKGRLRTLKTRYLAGEKKLETIHRESGCLFRLNVETCYFSPRLSQERILIAKKVKKKDRVIVMFAGVSPYPIVIAKLAKPKRVVSIELGRECCKYGKENARLNKTNVEVMQGDVKKVVKKIQEKFDVVVMARPQLKDTFLKEAFLVADKGARIFYRAFGKEEELESIKEEIVKEGKKSRRKVKFIEIRKAGDIAPYKYRFNIEFKVN